MTRFQNVGLKNQDEMNVQRSQLVGGGGEIGPNNTMYGYFYIYSYI